ncbi:MAG: cell filamentation protein Fic [Erysipelotrichaceae bacterium]|nr:cell filamentation protein Fic [Erysipelotrichaceae bacterium]
MVQYTYKGDIIMDFDKYKKESPEKYKKIYAWETAIGLQKVDDLTPSEYLYEIAERNINDELSFEEAQNFLNSYYLEKPKDYERTEEADKVSIRIAELISSNSFVFSLIEYINIHKQLFEGIYDHAGQIRTYNISKKEWVLNGNSVAYGNSYNLEDLLEYDFKKEKEFKYSNLTKEEFIKHIAEFISNLWQIHAFSEGNTRTTAVFLIKYLNTKGFEINNDLFAKHSWYFRNALVRANYSNFMLGIDESTKYLEMFLENLLFNTEHILSNKMLHILYKESSNKQLDLTEIEKKVINIIKENQNITIEECSIKINKSLRTTKNIFKNLKEKNILKRIGSNKTGYWEV